MKKLILLLIIPIFTYSQTYNELMGIESINDFKRVMIENGYEMDLDNDTKVMFGYICSESKLDGKFGFMVTDESGMIIFYPNNH